MIKYQVIFFAAFLVSFVKAGCISVDVGSKVIENILTKISEQYINFWIAPAKYEYKFRTRQGEIKFYDPFFTNLKIKRPAKYPNTKGVHFDENSSSLIFPYNFKVIKEMEGYIDFGLQLYLEHDGNLNIGVKEEAKVQVNKCWLKKKEECDALRKDLQYLAAKRIFTFSNETVNLYDQPTSYTLLKGAINYLKNKSKSENVVSQFRNESLKIYMNCESHDIYQGNQKTVMKDQIEITFSDFGDYAFTPGSKILESDQLKVNYVQSGGSKIQNVTNFQTSQKGVLSDQISLLQQFQIEVLQESKKTLVDLEYEIKFLAKVQHGHRFINGPTQMVHFEALSSDLNCSLQIIDEDICKQIRKKIQETMVFDAIKWYTLPNNKPDMLQRCSNVEMKQPFYWIDSNKFVTTYQLNSLQLDTSLYCEAEEFMQHIDPRISLLNRVNGQNVPDNKETDLLFYYSSYMYIVDNFCKPEQNVRDCIMSYKGNPNG